jgi:hypothetical protein
MVTTSVAKPVFRARTVEMALLDSRARMVQLAKTEHPARMERLAKTERVPALMQWSRSWWQITLVNFAAMRDLRARTGEMALPDSRARTEHPARMERPAKTARVPALT